MPAQKRHRTNYPGVYYIMGIAVATGKPDKIYYIDYRRNGTRIQEKAGRQSEDMTPARAAQKRADKIRGRVLSNKEQRQAEKAAKRAKDNRWTIDKLWNEYKAGRRPGKSLKIDTGRYEKYLKPTFKDVEPKDILPLDIERLKRRLIKKKSPQTVKHVLNLLTWIINFGAKRGLSSALSFHIEKPAVNNTKTEDLTQAQLKSLLKAISKDSHPQAGNMMLMALYSGMRRGEIFRLQWRHIDFNRGFIKLVAPKSGKDQQIPLNEPTRSLLKTFSRKKGNPYVFPGRKGQRVDINKALNEIKIKAKLPKDFRALHGLRHVYASMLASSGQVDMYVLQRLLTHKDPRMTQRYAHLRDQALKNAAEVAGDIMTGISIDNSKKAADLSSGH